MDITAAQYESLKRISREWQDVTLYPILPDDFRIVAESELEPGSYVGLWVGRECNGNPGRMYLGVELDGHTHS